MANEVDEIIDAVMLHISHDKKVFQTKTLSKAKIRFLLNHYSGDPVKKISRHFAELGVKITE